MINFRKITEENFKAIMDMKRPDEENFVAPNSYSLAQAWLYREDGDVFPFAIYNDDTAVGFMLLEEDREESDLVVWRIMFPPENENKGYGTAAMRLIIELARDSGKYRSLVLDCAQTNVKARHIYDKLGFIPTGEVFDHDIELQLML